MIASNPFDLVRPFLWIAAIAFVLGFATYALLGAGSIARTMAELRDVSAIEAPPAYEGPATIA
jgi:hypothetical protein